MADDLRPEDYVSYRDAARDILGRNSGRGALAAFGLDELLESGGVGEDLTPAYAFLEAQGYQRVTTPALALLGAAGLLGSSGAALLASPLGRSGLVGIPGYGPDEPVVVDEPGTGLVALPDVGGAVVDEEGPVADDYVTVVDLGRVPPGGTCLFPEEELAGRRAAVVARTRLGITAELLGIVDRLLTDATAYAQQRRQFGAPIASYQAMQHLLAWGATERHQLTCLFDIAVRQTAGREPDPQLARLVKAQAGRTLHTIAQTAIQTTGAISFTWEYDQHRHHRRGLLLDQLAGPSAELVAEIGREVRTAGSVPELLDLYQPTG